MAQGTFILLALLTSAACLAAAPRADFYVSTAGRDQWSGTLEGATASGDDGPFGTLDRARRAVAELKRAHPDRTTPIVVQVRGGFYQLAEPLRFGPTDGGTAQAPVVYEAYLGERPVLSGGVRLTGFQVDGQGRWTLQIPEVARGEWNFIQLFVNGERRYRPRLPKDGYHYIGAELPPSEEHGGRPDRFRYREGDIRADWANRDDVEIITFHSWTADRHRIAAVDEARRVVSFTGATLGGSSFFGLLANGRYLIENVKEALTEPGEWYLDRPTGVLTYLPLPGEDPATAEVIAPRLERLVEIAGEPGIGLWVEHLTLRGLTFSHTNWLTPPQGHHMGQAEINVPAAIHAVGARHCALEACTISHTGNYALHWDRGCKHCRTEGCELWDLGAGGVKIGEQAPRDDDQLTSHNVVRGNLIAHAGRLLPAGIGVWVGHSPYNELTQNTIFDLYYSSFSVGWSWGYGRSDAHHNLIADNHCYQVGQDVLSDMGGIYTLGIAPGTTIRHNCFHDINCYSYGGWGIYFDEGSTGVVAENNLVYRTEGGGFHQHYGRENVLRNNIWAFDQRYEVARTRAEEHLSFTFERNIVCTNGEPLLGSNFSGNNYAFDNNVYWTYKGTPSFAGMTWEEWRGKGQDTNSVIADPRFVNVEADDFRLEPDSPALTIGFVPFPLTGFGKPTPSSPEALREVPRAFPAPGEIPPIVIAEDFELLNVGDKPPSAKVTEETDEATIRVTDETAATGQHSLKFVDAAGQKAEYNPHMYYEPGFKSGPVVGKFALRVEPGTHMYHEWRDYRLPPFRVGPALWVAADGQVTSHGKVLFQAPPSTWMTIRISVRLGDEADGTFDLSVTWPGRDQPLEFPGLACDPEFRQADWVGFTANADGPGVFYVDDIDVRPAVQ